MAVYPPWDTEVAGSLPGPAGVARRGTAHHPQRVRAWLGFELGLGLGLGVGLGVGVGVGLGLGSGLELGLGLGLG